MTNHERRAIFFHESIDEVENVVPRTRSSRESLLCWSTASCPTALRSREYRSFPSRASRASSSAPSLSSKVSTFHPPISAVIVASSCSVRQRIQSLGRMLRRKPGDVQHGSSSSTSATPSTSRSTRRPTGITSSARTNRYFTVVRPRHTRSCSGTSSIRAHLPVLTDRLLLRLTSTSLRWEMLSLVNPRASNCESTSIHNLRAVYYTLVPVPTSACRSDLAHNPHHRSRFHPCQAPLRANRFWRFGRIRLAVSGVTASGAAEPDPGCPSACVCRPPSGRQVHRARGRSRKGIVRFRSGPRGSHPLLSMLRLDHLLTCIQGQATRISGSRSRSSSGTAVQLLSGVAAVAHQHEYRFAPLVFRCDLPPSAVQSLQTTVPSMDACPFSPARGIRHCFPIPAASDSAPWLPNIRSA